MTVNRAYRRTATALERKGEAITSHLVLEILNAKEAADYIRLSKPTLDRLRVQGGGPRYAKLGGAVRYRRADLDAWLESKLISSTSEVA